VPFGIRLRGHLLVVPSEPEEALLLETNFKARRKFSNNSKNKLTGKALSYNGRERSCRE
jgi:hypothetical protein